MIDHAVVVVNLTGHKLTLGTRDTQYTFKSRGRTRAEPHLEVVERLHLWDYDHDTGVYVPMMQLEDSDVRSYPAVTDPDTLYVVSGLVERQIPHVNAVAPARIHTDGNSGIKYASGLMRHKRK